MVNVAMIVAMDEQGVIGRNNALPWRLPEDLRYFRRMTMGKPVVMGRKTWESIGRPLPGRRNIVVTRDENYQAPGADVVVGVEQALALATDIALVDGMDEIMVIGGARLYREVLPVANRLYLTRVHAEVEGDACLSLSLDGWHKDSEERHGACDENQYSYSFQRFSRSPRS